MQFLAACIQSNCQDDLAANVAAVLPMVEKAAAGGAKLICLPENAFLMENQGGKLFQKAVPLAEHAGVLGCQRIAKTHCAWVLIGSVPQQDAEAEGKVFNTSILIDDHGEIVSAYQKIHLFDVDLGGGESYRESNRFSGGCAAPLVGLPWGKLGLTICYDVRFPQLYRALAQGGAEMLAIPAAFTKVTGEAHWHVLQRARAIENGCFVFAAAQTGEHPGGRFTYGHSLIIDPWGKVQADAGEEVGIISATIDMDLVAQTRSRVPSLQHDREFVIC
jgi:deaminated glutathione amidase